LPHAPSLRAKRSNPETLAGGHFSGLLRRFAPRNDGAVKQFRYNSNDVAGSNFATGLMAVWFVLICL